MERSVEHQEHQTSKIIVSERDLSHIVQHLNDLVLNGNAVCALLLDSSGQVIRACGDTSGLDVTVLGALLAGNFGSAREIARLLREESFTAQYQQGETTSVFTQLVGGRWMLSVVFDQRTQIGLIKSLSQRQAVELGRLLQRSARRPRGAEGVVSREWRSAAGRALDQALGGEKPAG